MATKGTRSECPLFFSPFPLSGRLERQDAGGSDGDLIRGVHFFGFHPLLGAFAARELGGDAQDGHRTIQSGVAEHRPVVTAPPARTDRGATAGIESQVTRSLRVLRSHRQYEDAGVVPLCSRASLAEVA